MNINTKEFFDSVGASIDELIKVTTNLTKTVVDFINSDQFKDLMYQAIRKNTSKIDSIQ